MKRNLFVLHTQYNIILALSVINEYFKDSQNDLILYPEFEVTEDYLKTLKKLFTNILCIRDNYKGVETNPIIREWKLMKEYLKYKNSRYSKSKYENVFLTQERPFDVLVLGHQKTKGIVTACNIEEDCYYSVNTREMKYEFRPMAKSDILRRVIYGKKYIYETVYFYGQSSFYDSHYLTYPNNLRKELSPKKVFKISVERILEAVDQIYAKVLFEIPKGNKFLLIFCDLINRYNNPVQMTNLLRDVILKAQCAGYKIICKYHPRETQKIELDSISIFELPKIIPAEKILCDLIEKDIYVIGNTSTSILMANLFGYKTATLALLDNNPNVEMITKFQRMGILTPSSVEDFVFDN